MHQLESKQSKQLFSTMQMSEDWSTGRKLTQKQMYLVALFARYIYLMSNKHHLHDKGEQAFPAFCHSPAIIYYHYECK